MESSVTVNLRIGPEGFHHSLLTGSHMIGMLHNLITVVKYRLHIAVAGHLAGTEISPVIRPDRETASYPPGEPKSDYPSPSENLALVPVPDR